MSGKQNKEYNEDEVDLVEARHRTREEQIMSEVQFRKQARQDRENERNRDLEKEIKDIHSKYGYEVKEEYLLIQGITKVFPLICNKCKTFKVFPYAFLTRTNKDNGKNHCSTCMNESSKTVSKCVEKNKLNCPCGLSYYCTDLKKSKHELSKTHINGVKQLKINNGKRIYKIGELRRICSANSIKYYNTLKLDEMLDQLIQIANIQIPVDLM